MLVLKEEWASHPKMLKAVFLAGDPAVKHFWFETVSAAGLAKTDGLVEVYRVPVVAQSCGLTPDRLDTFVRALVDADLFHDADALAGCRPCKDMLKSQGHTCGPDDLVVHDFLDHNPSKRNKGRIGKLREKRKNDLARKSSWLKEEVYLRDQGLCRYCGRRTEDNNPNATTALEFDHVDPLCFTPNHGNFADNLVTSCKRCNRAKSERTPDDAGMPLLAAGTTARDVTDGRARTVETPSEVGSPEGVRAGSGRDRAGIGPGSGGAGRGRSGKAKGRGRGGSGASTRPQDEPP